MPDLSTPEGQILKVSSFTELVDTPFHDHKNALCWNRSLKGDFSEIASKLETEEDIITINKDDLLRLELTEQGQIARETLIQDIDLFTTHGSSPILNLIRCYERDDSYPAFPTDVYSFHVDRSPIPSHTILCTYHGESSDIIANSSAEQKILIPEIRSELKKLYDGEETGFEDFLSEYFFDLHYKANNEADIVNLGIGHIWRLAIDHPNSPVLPCIHRAPEENGQSRLLLIC